jgi:hypothetical protein
MIDDRVGPSTVSGPVDADPAGADGPPDTAATETVTVAFEGEGSGAGPLSWGQQHIWHAIQATRTTMNMCAMRELGPGATLEEFTEELRFYLTRFQAMRTLLRFPAGSELPEQVVVASGETSLRVVEAPAGADPGAVAAAIAAAQEDDAFDYEREFPIRLTLVRHRGALTHLVTTLSHFATDALGAFAMYRDFAGRDPATGLATGRAPTHPLDLARKQQELPGRRQSDASLQYWEQQLRDLPAGRPREFLRPAGARYRQLSLSSPALSLAVGVIARRTGAEASDVLLTAFGVALGQVGGASPVAAQTLVSNRFRPGLTGMVGNVSQTGLFVLDVAGVTVDEAVLRARRAAMRTYKHAYFDLREWTDLLARLEAERGAPFEICYYNDRPAEHRSGGDGEEPDLRAALALTETAWTELAYFNERIMVTVDDAQDAVKVTVLADTGYVPPAEMEDLARRIEAITVAAAMDPSTTTGVG